MKQTGHYNADDVVDAVIQKVREGLGRASVFNFLRKELGLSEPQAYKYMRDASNKTAELYKDMNVNAIQDALNNLEIQREEALKDKNRKLVLEITKEMHAIMGLNNKQKVEHSGSIESVNTIKLIEVVKDEEGKDDGNEDHQGLHA